MRAARVRVFLCSPDTQTRIIVQPVMLVHDYRERDNNNDKMTFSSCTLREHV